VLFEGWREYIESPIPRIAFTQWEQYTKAIASARRLVPPSRWFELHLEHLLENPEDGLSRICAAVEIQQTGALRKKLAELSADPVNAISEPEQEKWRQDNANEIRALLPEIAASAPLAGYRVDPKTGAFEISD
jgi:hypothetical protein